MAVPIIVKNRATEDKIEEIFQYNKVDKVLFATRSFKISLMEEHFPLNIVSCTYD